MPAFSSYSTSTTSANSTHYRSSTFTPRARDLLVAVGAFSGTVLAAPLVQTTNQPLWSNFAYVTSARWATSANSLYCYVATGLASSVPTTIVWDLTGDAGTGGAMWCGSMDSMTRISIDAVRQRAVLLNQPASTIPSTVFAASTLTANPILAFCGVNSTTPTLTAPAGYTEVADQGYGAPSTGIWVGFRNSGTTSTQVLWQTQSSLSLWGSGAVEFNALERELFMGTICDTY